MAIISQLETLNTLHKCAEIEEVMGKMYDFFAETYQKPSFISRVFKKTAEEERNHEYQIRLAIKSLSPTIEAMTLTSVEADKHLSMAKETLGSVKTSAPVVEEALALAIRLEAISSHIHMDVAARFTDQSCAKLFKAMMSADDAHIATLEQALQELRKP